MKCETPARERGSSREPVPIQRPSETERTPRRRSVTTRSPPGRVVISGSRTASIVSACAASSCAFWKTPKMGIWTHVGSDDLAPTEDPRLAHHARGYFTVNTSALRHIGVVVLVGLVLVLAPVTFAARGGDGANHG